MSQGTGRKVSRKILILTVVVLVIASIAAGYLYYLSKIELEGFWLSYGSNGRYVAHVHDDIIDIYSLSDGTRITKAFWSGQLMPQEDPSMYKSLYDDKRTSILSEMYCRIPATATCDIEFRNGVLIYKQHYTQYADDAGMISHSTEIMFSKTSKTFQECIDRSLYCDSVYEDATSEPQFTRGDYWLLSNCTGGQFVQDVVALEVTNQNPYYVEVPIISASWYEMESLSPVRLQAPGRLRPGDTTVVICECNWDIFDMNGINFGMKTPDPFCDTWDPDECIEISGVDVEDTGRVSDIVSVSVECQVTTEERELDCFVEVLFYNGDDIVGAAYSPLIIRLKPGENTVELDHIAYVIEDEYDRVEVEIL